ncbi:hypothetical protein FQN54_007183 [Arachnomyces sp. PD_36]|nr:hypothetical protein FQN54_007183 [Arachnomyces sp. PD_36]
MAALLPTSSLSTTLRQQSTSLSIRLNSSSSLLSGRPYSTSSSASRLGQRVRHGTVPLLRINRIPRISQLTRPPASQPRRPSPLTSSTTRSTTSSSPQSRRTITVQAHPPTSSSTTPLPLSKRAQKHLQKTTSTLPTTPSEPLPLTNLPYFIRRTPSNQLPVYIVTKSGGTRQQTKIQKTEGDLDALRSDLARALGLESSGSAKSPEVVVNRTNGHIVVKVGDTLRSRYLDTPIGVAVYGILELGTNSVHRDGENLRSSNFYRTANSRYQNYLPSMIADVEAAGAIGI